MLVQSKIKVAVTAENVLLLETAGIESYTDVALEYEELSVVVCIVKPT